MAESSYRAAWQSEPTNPDILLSHANLLRDNGRAADARKLYKQITSGTWQQPRFNNTVSFARQELEK